MQNEKLKRYLLEKIRLDDPEYCSKIIENFQVTGDIVNDYIQECLRENIIEKSMENVCGYRLQSTTYDFVYGRENYITEESALSDDVLPLLSGISKEAREIWCYTFSEMMNNAIEHSGYQNICCRVKKDYLYTEIGITDDGIGIFRNIQRFMEENTGRPVSYQDVQVELYKGKLTTNPENHSGEGIFFTSKMLKRFAVWSENTIFSAGCDAEEKLIQSHLIAYYTKLSKIGTMVVLQLENDCKRNPGEIFDLFATVDDGFVKTVIPIVKVCGDLGPIARSQARKILYRLEKFKYVELDFSGVDFMGQGFADEIFRVFKNQCPQTKITAVHASPSVYRMIRHVQLRECEAAL